MNGITLATLAKACERAINISNDEVKYGLNNDEFNKVRSLYSSKLRIVYITDDYYEPMGDIPMFQTNNNNNIKELKAANGMRRQLGFTANKFDWDQFI